MTYYISKTISTSFDDAIERISTALSGQGFGILTQIDMSTTLKYKLGVDFRPYMVLGACNPGFAHKALETEDKIGTMLPCNVVVQELEPGKVEIAAVDPVASMQAIHNPYLMEVAGLVRTKLKTAIDAA